MLTLKIRTLAHISTYMYMQDEKMPHQKPLKYITKPSMGKSKTFIMKIIIIKSPRFAWCIEACKKILVTKTC